MIRALHSSVLAVVLVALAGCGSGVTSSNKSGGSGGGGGSTANVKHVVVVVFENQDYANVVGSSAMPNWNQLANQYSLATQFYANFHPSIGNYFMMTAGQNPASGLSDPDAFSGTVSGDNVASVLSAAGMTWKVYAQSLPSIGYTGGDQYPYIKHHDPFAYFDSVLNSSSQTSNIVPLSQFASDVNSGSLPNYSFIVPDNRHNGHDCPNGGADCLLSDRLAAVDNFLGNQMAPLLTNSSVLANTIVIVTYDESASDNTNGGGRIPVIIAGGPVKTGYQSSTMYQFPSLLRFSLQSLGVTNYPGAASSAPPMTEFLK